MTEPVVPFRDRLRAAGLTPEPAHRANGAQPLRPVPASDAACRYAGAALTGEAERVASAAVGTRNDVLNRAAYSVGQLVAGGALDGEAAAAALAAAAGTAGLPEREVTVTIRSGFTAAASSPRTVPERGELASFTVPTRGIEPPAVEPTPESQRRIVTGGSFVLDTPDTPPSLWGAGNQVLWSAGESLMVVGPPGVGKTTLAHQLALARIGLLPDVLGWPVTQTGGRVLLLSCDRPPQSARSLRRMVDESARAVLDERLIVWKGPPLVDLAREPHMLLALARNVDADTVLVDSLKDVALELSRDETGAGWNNARQTALAEGVELVELHHQRKAAGDNKRPTSLADVYGSTWITAGAGSVVLLWGAAGDPVVELLHLKQPAEQVGPLQLLHDHPAGRTTVWHSVDVLALVRAAGGGLTASDVARAMFTATPSPAEVEKARRRLETLRDEGRVHRRDGQRGGSGGTEPATYHGVDLFQGVA